MAKTRKNIKLSDNPFVSGILQGTDEIVKSLRGEKCLTARKVRLAPAVKPITARQIIKLRTEQLRVSQTVFASLLNVSPQAVRNWEQGVNHPSGSTLRLLQIAQTQPQMLLRMIS